MKLTIIFRDESREVECAEARVNNGMLYVYDQIPQTRFGPAGPEPSVKQIWNMNNIIGVEMD